MARLRIETPAADAATSMLQDSIHEDETARSAFTSTSLPQQPSIQQDDATDLESHALKVAEIPKPALVCKKFSPRKDARKQVQLKPMNFTRQDEDLSVLLAPRDLNETRTHQRRNVFSPAKMVASRLPSNTSFESMVSDTDDSSDFSLPASLASTDALFDIGARIPESLISPTKRQLFSPTKQKPVTNADLDDLAFALSGAKIDEMSAFEPDLDGSIDEPISHRPLGQPEFHLGMPTLQPSFKSSDSGDHDVLRPSTPPPLPSPSKSKLVSPSKIKCRIPTPPARSSPNAFWSVEMVNDWNEQHSPQKIVRSPKKSRFLQLDESTSPSGSPAKQTSPYKLSRETMAAKKDFESRKKDIAYTFLAELDATITGGEIARLSASTGGVQLVWSKTLNSTAGRANWKRETTKSRGSADIISDSKQSASIELAEKVINDETRLLNVLAHEFCHLANFMVSGIKDRPHGAEFKAWGRKCTQAFGARGVEVTTKHTYEIDYKYIWECTKEDCRMEFKRHSKSIDPSRHTCGVCKAKLVQVKPVPRNTAGAKTTGYAGFVKEHFAAIKADMPGASQKEVMSRIGERYRAAKNGASQADHSAEPPAEIDTVAEELEAIVLEDTNC
ncbi:hypothetical protein AMS68_006090 [Peltaster fructicola]|uniref:SprT-like domain-containing protein n=1 Tax=Peltaster fructicola TaxID=286661 RepID=A0A6H0Y0N7_9PEZI|nr:hypothetical protein AMS68_006090 [Peltaster fructicola]